jgi:glutamyl-tRNA synthetase
VNDDAVVYDAEAKTKALTPASVSALEQLASRFQSLPEYTAAALEAALKGLATELGVKVGVLIAPCRVGCTGRTVGPSLYHLLEVLGRDRVARRLARARTVAAS